MKTFSFLSTLALAVSLVSSQTIHNKKKCNVPLHIIATRGHGTSAGLGGLNDTVAAIRHAIHGTTYYAVPFYTKPNGTSYNFQAEVQNATNNWWLPAILNYTESCPYTPIAVIGYSEGAVIAMNGLCGASSYGFTRTAPLNASLVPNLIATIVFGDESYVGGQSYNAADCKGRGTAYRYNPAGCAAFAPTIQSYCQAQDPQCCMGGNNITLHHTYPEVFDANVTAFIKTKYLAFNRTGPPPKTVTRTVEHTIVKKHTTFTRTNTFTRVISHTTSSSSSRTHKPTTSPASDSSSASESSTSTDVSTTSSSTSSSSSSSSEAESTSTSTSSDPAVTSTSSSSSTGSENSSSSSSSSSTVEAGATVRRRRA